MKLNYIIFAILFSVTSPIVMAQAASGHECDAAGSAPKGTIDAPSELIDDGNGNKVIGKGVTVTLKATLSDKDKHKTSATDSGTDVDDTFDKTGAIEWSEKDGKGTIADKNAKVTTFTTPNNTGAYQIILKIKDDGTHYQDLTSLTQSDTLNITVVDPDSVRIASQSPSISGRTAYTPVVIQVTYKGKDLPWIGKLAEKYKASSQFATLVLLPYSYNGNGTEFFPNWNMAGDYANDTSKSGQLTDNHNTPLPATIPAGEYYDASGRHEIAFVNASNKTSLQVFKDEDYVKHAVGTQEQAVHNEHP